MAIEIKIQIDTKTDDNDATLYRASLTPTMGGWESDWTDNVAQAWRDGAEMLMEYLTFDGDDNPIMTREEAEAYHDLHYGDMVGWYGTAAQRAAADAAVPLTPQGDIYGDDWLDNGILASVS